MATVAHGPLASISFGGREFQCSGDSAGTLRGGGYSVEHKSNGNQVSGRKGMQPVPWSFEGQEIQINMNEDDWEYITDLHNGTDPFDVVMSFVFGGDWGASGGFEGEPPAFEAFTGGATVDLKGFGKVRRL